MMKKENWAILLISLIYIILSIYSLNNCYFWDNIQQTSKEAYWFYSNNFSTLSLPGFGEHKEIVSTGYHPPLNAMMTAILWKVFGLHIWVSHLFILTWALALIYNTYKLLSHFIPTQLIGLVMMIPLLDSTVMTQISIASPDIILLTSFVMALRAIIEKKNIFLTISLIFLSLINGRGMFAASILFIYSIIDSLFNDKEKFTFSLVWTKIMPFIPAGCLLITYFTYYFYHNGWFFSNPENCWAEGWQSPEGIKEYIKNLAAYGLRLLENGRIFIWITGIWVAIKIKNNPKLITGRDLSLTILLGLFLLLYLYFAMTTKIVIGSRYYMPIFILITILTYRLLARTINERKVRIIAAFSIVFIITGNLWIYPDKISKAWDATLAHLPYYELREQCLDYLEQNHIKDDDIAGGFCFAGNQKYIDLKDRDYRISSDPNKQYFIYSNISNIDDSVLEEFQDNNKWIPIKTFKKHFVYITIFEKIESQEQAF